MPVGAFSCAMHSRWTLPCVLLSGLAALLLSARKPGIAHNFVAVYTAKYLWALEKRELATKSATALVLFSVSDAVAQIITSSSALSIVRVLRFAAWGSVMGAPLLHLWYNFLANFFGRHLAPLGVWYQAFLMSSVDQALFFPTYSSLYFLYAACSTGGSYIDAFIRVRRELWPLVARATLYWVPLNTLNFALIPLKHRVLFVCVAALFWNTYFSYYCSRPIGKSGSRVNDEREKLCEAGLTSEVHCLAHRSLDRTLSS
jgi:protein Mpv17